MTWWQFDTYKWISYVIILAYNSVGSNNTYIIIKIIKLPSARKVSPLFNLVIDVILPPSKLNKVVPAL